MSTDPNENNPYRSPQEPCNLPEPANASARRRFRWRVIPVTLLCLFGVFLIFGGLFMLGSGFWQIAQNKSPNPAMGTSIFIVPGCLFLFAGWNIWKGPRRRAALATLLAFACYMVCGAITAYFGW
jgi:hypothetical protein